MSPLVALQDVTATYDGNAVLKDIRLSLAAGDFLGVVGPSGCGKTSLLKVILGSLQPSVGQVVREPRLRMGYVPQVDTVNWHFPVTVSEVLLMSCTRGTTDEKTRLRSILQALSLDGYESRHISKLSGGQQQRVFIARGLMSEPQLLLLDEPTSNVDVATRHEILHLLRQLNESGLAVVLTTHDLNSVAAHLPSVVCLNREVIASGVPREVLTPSVLEKTYGAKMSVLEHGGMPLVVDH